MATKRKQSVAERDRRAAKKELPVVPAGVVIPLDVAVLVISVFLPSNERKMRKAAPGVVEAVTEFKRCVRARVEESGDRASPGVGGVLAPWLNLSVAVRGSRSK